MKALTLHQPYASLVVLGIKTWETRPAPFNGDMRPAGVRGLPGLRIDRGERIAIHAGLKMPQSIYPDWITDRCRDGTWRAYRYGPEPLHPGLTSLAETFDLPLGAIVGYVTVAEVLPIVDVDELTHDDIMAAAMGRYPCIGVDGSELIVNGTVDITDQLPYGHWRPGNWAMGLVDPEPCGPIPAKGKQGVWEWTP